MGALCKFFPELEINSVRNSANKYFCDVGAIGLLNKDKKTNKYRVKCTGGRLDKKNRLVRLGRDSAGKYTGSKVGLNDDIFLYFSLILVHGQMCDRSRWKRFAQK